MMHMRGTPQTMRDLTNYDDLLSEMRQYFEKKVEELNHLGVEDVIIDVGFGFSKTLDQNYEILRNLDYFKEVGQPLLAGISRKSMIFKALGTDPSGSLNGTTALNVIALLKGASILRAFYKAAKSGPVSAISATRSSFLMPASIRR